MFFSCKCFVGFPSVQERRPLSERRTQLDESDRLLIMTDAPLLSEQPSPLFVFPLHPGGVQARPGCERPRAREGLCHQSTTFCLSTCQTIHLTSRSGCRLAEMPDTPRKMFLENPPLPGPGSGSEPGSEPGPGSGSGVALKSQQMRRLPAAGRVWGCWCISTGA